MSNYLNEIESNANNLEHLLNLMFAPGLTEEEKNRICAYIDEAINLNAVDKKIDAEGWRRNLKTIIEKFNGIAADDNPKLKEIKKIIGNIKWHEEQILYSFGEFNKLAMELASQASKK